MTIFGNRPFFLLTFFCCFIFFTLQAQQHPFFGRSQKGIKSKTQATPFFSGRVTAPDSIGFGGEPGVVWERKLSELYPGANSYYLMGNIKLSDGNFLTSGYVGYNDSAGHVYIKYNSDGVVLWKDKVVGISNYNHNLFPTSDSGWIAINEKNRDSVYQRYINKYTKSGFKKWEVKVTNTASDHESIISTSDGGYLVTYFSQANGKQLSCNSGTSTLYELTYFNKVSLLRLDSEGGIIWQKDVFSQNDYRYTSFSTIKILKAKTGYFLIGDYSYQNRDSTSCWNLVNKTQDIFVGKIDEAGDSLMLKFYGGNRDDRVFSAFSSVKDSGIVLLGLTKSRDRDLLNLRTDTVYSDGWMFQLNDTGRIGRNYVFRNMSNSENILVSGIELQDTSYVLSLNGQSASSSLSSIIKVKRTGAVEWIRNEPLGIFTEIQSVDNEITYARFIPDETEGYFGKFGAASSITGSVFYDLNKNNIKDANEPYANKFLVTSEKAGYTRSSVATNGWFRNDVDTGTYKTTVKLINDYYVPVPAEKQTTFTTLFQNDTVHFALQPVAGKRDVSINLIPITPARPGFNAKYKLTFRNNGTDTIPNGGVLLIKDSKTTLVSSLPAAGLVTGDSILWGYAGLKPFDSYSIDIEVKLAAPPTLNNGDTLRFKAFITSTTGSAAAVDLTPLDDTSYVAQLVTGAYDPNDKHENVAGKIPLAKVVSGENIQYVIRFQNTGTDTAFTVRIADTLDAKLNWNSLQMTAASHQYKMTVSDGNKITWTFNNINLPDSNINEPLSNGYIAFTIKAKTNLASGDYFQNKASIYFDYNLPVVTNTATTVVSSTILTNVRDLEIDGMQLLALPNPTTGSFYLKISGDRIGKFEYSVIDLFGRVLQTGKTERSSRYDAQYIPLNLNNAGAGVYYIVLRQKDKLWQQKLIVQ